MSVCDLITSARPLACGIPYEQQMPVLIYLLLQLAGMSASASSLVALASNEAAIPRQLQLPVAIWLLEQIMANGTVVANPQMFSGNYGGYPHQPPFTPIVSVATAFDSSDGSVWNWWGGLWH